MTHLRSVFHTFRTLYLMTKRKTVTYMGLSVRPVGFLAPATPHNYHPEYIDIFLLTMAHVAETVR